MFPILQSQMRIFSYRIFCLLIEIFISVEIIAQKSNIDREIDENISGFRKITVSFGRDTLTEYRNFNNKLVKTRIFQSLGTGVCFYLRDGNEILPCIITAKHVIYEPLNKWQPDSINIRFHDLDTLSVEKYYGTKIPLYDNSTPLWLPFPDSSIDLACIILNKFLQYDIKNVQTLPYSYFASNEDYFDGKEIYILGYPTAVGFDLLSKAVLRKGIVSWIPPSNPPGDKILIDANVFPGNSGGPVFSVSKNSGYILSDTVLQAPKFYGIVTERRFSYNNLQSQSGKIIDAKGNEIFSSESMGIGVVITANKVREFLDLIQTELNSIRKRQK
jgi:hypothetical protein